MQDHYNLTDEVFEQQFRDCSLDPSTFSHEAHLRLAWIHIQKYGIQQALTNIQTQLKNFVKHLGAEDKYNTTLTIAAVKAVYHFMLKSPSTSFKDFIQENPRLNFAFKSLIESHYSFDVFENENAKHQFLEPDVSPFD